MNSRLTMAVLALTGLFSGAALAAEPAPNEQAAISGKASVVMSVATEATEDDAVGILNPQELTIEYWVAKSKEPVFNSLARGNRRRHALDGLDRGEWLRPARRSG